MVRQSRTKGFTLPELLITIAIAATLLGVGVPSYSSYVASRSVQSRAAELHADLSLARLEAIRRVGIAEVRALDGNWSNGWVVTVRDETNADVVDVEIGRRGPAEVRVAVTQASLDAAVVRFGPNGALAESSSVAATVCVGELADLRARLVEVAASGFVQSRLTASCGT
jgi:type IV fimbrial biogenesis protein FimT